MQKPSSLLVLPVLDFHQRLQAAQSGFKGLEELPVSSIHVSQIHECFTFPRSNLEHWSFCSQVFTQAFSVRLNIQVPATA